MGNQQREKKGSDVFDGSCSFVPKVVRQGGPASGTPFESDVWSKVYEIFA
jgi:hypothetical protein